MEIEKLYIKYSRKTKRWIFFLWKDIWWNWCPAVTIRVKWPRIENCDPNWLYRPWLEENVGIQSVHWDWDLVDNDVMEDKLTIKFIRYKSKWAMIAALKWT